MKNTYNIKMLKVCKDFAKRKNGFCLSKKYKNATSKLLWQCKEKHQWNATYQNVLNCNSWCPECVKKRIPNLEELKDFAINKNGVLLSTKYTNNMSKLSWQCEHNHQWEANWNSIKSGKSWCPDCNINNQRLNIKECQEFAVNKNGICLSTEYINCESKMLWQCEKGHQWKTSFSNVKHNGTWCPKCSILKTENKCKELLEEKLNIKFEKIRIYYDIGNNKKWLAFDGYNKKYNIAFEYHGIQHYEIVNYWYKNKKQFLDAQKRDDLKEQYAAENDIKLIIIPYTESKNLETYIARLEINV